MDRDMTRDEPAKINHPFSRGGATRKEKKKIGHVLFFLDEKIGHVQIYNFQVDEYNCDKIQTRSVASGQTPATMYLFVFASVSFCFLLLFAFLHRHFIDFRFCTWITQVKNKPGEKKNIASQQNCVAVFQVTPPHWKKKMKCELSLINARTM